ncbi:MAG: hypothetical protein GYA78_07400 [Caldisericales bacterium]|nr:hypothetical protein [Caldisericales bacterium]
MKTNPEVTEYLVLAYKGELAIKSADTSKVRQWALVACEAIATKYKNACEQYLVNHPKAKEAKISRDFVDAFFGAIGATIIYKECSFDLPEGSPTMNQAIKAARILSAHAYELQSFPRFAWGLASIVFGMFFVASAFSLWFSHDFSGWAIFGSTLLFMAYCIYNWRQFENVERDSRDIKDRVERSK